LKTHTKVDFFFSHLFKPFISISSVKRKQVFFFFGVYPVKFDTRHLQVWNMLSTKYRIRISNVVVAHFLRSNLLYYASTTVKLTTAHQPVVGITTCYQFIRDLAVCKARSNIQRIIVFLTC
jgi:hypothetical protein